MFGLCWLTSLAGAAFVFVQGPVRGHGAVVPVFFLMLIEVLAMGFAAFLAWLAAKANEAATRYRVASMLSLMGAVGWIIWFFLVTR